MSVPATGWPAATRRRPRASAWPVSVVASAAVLAAVVVCAAAGPLLAPFDAGDTDLAKSVTLPSASNPLGTDELGRDILSRVVVGARSSIGGPVIIAAATLAVATVLALFAAYRRGWADELLGRVMDTIYSLPALLIAIVVVGVVGGGYGVAIVVLVVLHVPPNFRIIRGAALEQRGLPYVEAAQTLGYSTARILGRHLLPNVMPFVVVCFFLRFTFAIVELSSLSFIGLGVPPGSADWGRMLAENRHFLELNPAAAIAPGLALVLTAASTNIVGHRLYDRFASQGRAR